MPSCTRSALTFVTLALALCCGSARARAEDPLPTTLPDEGAPPPDDEPGPPLRFEASLMAAVSAPLAGNPDKAGFGFAVTYGMGWGEIPIALGLDFMSIGSIGDAEDRLDLTLGDEAVRAQRATHTRLLHFEAWLRVQPAHWRVRPYLEGFIGAQLYQPKYVVRLPGQDVQSDLVNGSDWVRSHGYGAGVEVVGLLNRSGTMSLVLGLRHVFGGRAEVTRPTILAGETFDTHLSAGTSALLFMVGVGGHYDLGAPAQESEFLGD